MYLTDIQLIQDIRNLSKGFTIKNLQPITLLVGDQGSGKSTILKLLGDNDTSYLDVSLSEDCKENGCTTYYFDSEKDNPRTKDIRMYSNPNGTDKGIGGLSALVSRFESHGEVLIDFTVNGINRADNCVMFFDEPESGLSIRSQFKLLESIINAVERSCQFIIATHCMPLIESQDTVFSMEHNKWMTSRSFIDTQKKW